MNEFILEIFCEEIPARMQAAAQQKLAEFFTEQLTAQSLPYTAINSYVTPRRLVLHVQGLPLKQADRYEERKGPRVDAPETAIQGFLQANTLERDACQPRDLGKKGVFLFADVLIVGQETAAVLAEMTQLFLKEMRWPKSMRWGCGSFTWVRPIQHLLLLFNGVPLDFIPPHPDIKTGPYSFGHRFMAPGSFLVHSWPQYVQTLKEHKVILDAAERRQLILDAYQAIAQTQNARLPKEGQKQVEQVAGLVEWPVVCCGQFSEHFLEIPPEILTTSMWTHQFFTPLYDQTTGHLKNSFLFTANKEAPNGMDQIIAGNEAVLRARLQDAEFFWKTDRQQSLDQWNEKLEKQIFHVELGSVRDRLARFQRLAKHLDPENQDLQQACHYAKADLASAMVGEFPELQGVMGGYYLANKGYAQPICEAVAQHYLDEGHTSLLAAQLALIEKVELLGCFFAVGIKPTSSKDPYALRRAAIGILKLLRRHPVKTPLSQLFETVYHSFDAPKKVDFPLYQQELHSFMTERFRYVLKAAFSSDISEAVLQANWFVDQFSEAYHLCEYVSVKVLPHALGQQVITTFDRIANILQFNTAGQPTFSETKIEPALFEHAQETTLFALIQEGENSNQFAPNKADFATIFHRLQAFSEPIQALFDVAMINDPNPARMRNRQSLLAQIYRIFMQVIDFTKLQKKPEAVL